MEKGTYLGLTFYGGVSLAVFEAGVAYELVRAVQYSRARDEVDDLHIDVLTGTSAGGLTVVQLAAALAGKNPDGVLSRMISMWANTADIGKLLPEKDFKGQGVLDNRVIRSGIEEMLKTASAGSASGSALEEDLDLLLTVTNFTGLREPVFLPPETDGARAPVVFPTMRHCEYERFTAGDIGNPVQWPHIIQAAACTAGFPAAFPPVIKKSRSLPEDVQDQFVYVDGGVKDNWPLGAALEEIRRRPAPKRKYLFVDPNDTFRLPGYGGPSAHQLTDDPYSILSRLLSVARSDSVYRDLEELRKTNTRLDLLKDLSPLVFEQEDLRRLLGSLHQRVAQNVFNHEARALWLMIPGTAAGLETIQDLWKTIDSIGRYTLRARTEEYLRLALDKGQINRGAFDNLILILDQPEHWKGYYKAVRAIEALAPHFRNLRYRVWREVYRPSDGRRPLETFPPDLMEALTRQMQELLERSLDLQKERMALAESFFQEAGIAGFDINQFYEYAQAMQVLESLAGLKGKGRMDIARITPFDIYAESAVMRDQHPLAGGALGAFGGFLSKNWRLNDFMVGRLAMRCRLASEGLIPEERIPDYVEQVKLWDDKVIQSLAAGSEERRIAEAFQRLDTHEQGPFGNDSQKPQHVLLRRDGMALSLLSPSRVCQYLRRIGGSLRGLFRRNREMFPYTVLNKTGGVLILVQGLAWLFEQTVLYRPRTAAGSYLYVLLLGLVLGLILGIVLV